MITYKFNVPSDFDELPGDIQEKVVDKWEEMDREMIKYCKTHQCDGHYEGTCHEWSKFVEALKIIDL